MQQILKDSIEASSVKRTKGEVTVTVLLKARASADVKKVRLYEEDARQIACEELPGVELGECLENFVAKNYEDNKRSAIWRFVLVQEESVKSKKSISKPNKKAKLLYGNSTDESDVVAESNEDDFPADGGLVIPRELLED
jgi:hypothetical protein